MVFWPRGEDGEPARVVHNWPGKPRPTRIAAGMVEAGLVEVKTRMIRDGRRRPSYDTKLTLTDAGVEVWREAWDQRMGRVRALRGEEENEA